MFININRYGSLIRDKECFKAAGKYGKVVYLTSGDVNPEASPLEVWDIAKGLLNSVWDLQRHYSLRCTMICIDGAEPTLMYAAVRLFLEHGLKVCRPVYKITDDGMIFVRFREFINHNIYEDDGRHDND